MSLGMHPVRSREWDSYKAAMHFLLDDSIDWGVTSMYNASWLDIRDEFYDSFFNDEGLSSYFFSDDLAICAFFGC